MSAQNKKKDMKTLLTTNNAKTKKGEKVIDKISGLSYKTYILYMTSYTDNKYGVNVCSHASEGCISGCLVSSGFGGLYNSVKEGRRRKVEMFIEDRVKFINSLAEEIRIAIKKNEGKMVVVVRLNGTSDIVYERFRIFEGGKNIMEIFPEIQFYDYTKNWTRFNDKLPNNYHLTFSRSEDNEDKAFELLSRGINVSFIFREVPKEYRGYEVINGDEHDLTFLHKKGVIIGLRYKKNTTIGGKIKNEIAYKNGFVIEYKKE